MREASLFGWAEDEQWDAMFTPWSAAHAAAGYVARSVGVTMFEWNVVHAIYEGKDMFLKQEVSNSFVNSVGDQALANVAYLVGPKLSRFHAIGLFAVLVSGLALHEHIG